MTGATTQPERVNPQAVGVPLDEQGCIADTLPCLGCDYDLRTRPLESRCPECGLAVGRSAVGNLLRYAEPKWVRQVWEGLNCLSILIASVLVLIVLGSVDYFGIHTRLVPEMVLLLLPAAALAAAPVMGIYGLWKTTRPDPRGISEGLFSNRRLPRYALFVLPLITVGVAAAIGVTPHPMRQRLLPGGYYHAPGDIGFEAGLALIGTSVMLLAALLMLHLRAFAQRAEHYWLAHCLCALAAVTVPVAIAQPFMVNDWFGLIEGIENAMQLGSGRSGYMYQFFGYWDVQDFYVHVMQKAIVLISFVAVILFIWTWRVMTQQARLAEATWAAKQHVTD